MPNGYLGLGGICVESLQIIEDEGLELPIVEGR